jgi:acyl-CoA synthetase (NDP forming)
MNFRILENLVSLKYRGKIYPVNPHTEEILGIKAFERLQDIPAKVELVVSAVPAKKTMDILRQSNAIGVKHIVIISGGFSEGGGAGKQLHHNMTDFAKINNIRILGPNTLSPVNPANNFAISFNPIEKLNRGGLSFAFQSGFYEPMINWIFSHLGINKMLDMGNKLDINEVDALEYFARDPQTEVIAMHIESLKGDGRRFYSLLKSATRIKPVIILKTGRTPSGSKAAASHTGSLARENDAIFDSVLKQAGAVRARNLEEFFDFAKAFQFLEAPQGNRMAIITLSGGEGVMATDAGDIQGLKLARLGDHTYAKLKKVFPPWDIPPNPFDAGVCMEFQLADMMTFFETLLAIPADEYVDCSIMQLVPWTFNTDSKNTESSEDPAASLQQLYIQWLLNIKKMGKPFALWCSSAGKAEMALIEKIETHRIPVFRSSERAIKALATMNRYRSWSLSQAASAEKRALAGT